MNDCWFTSDEHYGHQNVLKFCKRPYANLEDMREGLIQNHNSVVKKGDLVYHNGDMFWRTVPVHEAESIILRLNGQHFYVNGNHDELIERNKSIASLFVWRKDIAKLKFKDKPNIILCHYAMRVWEGSHRGDWHLYGHSHNGLSRSVQGVTKEESPLSFDVGVDAHNMFPISLEEVALRMEDIKKGWEQIVFDCPGCGHEFIATDRKPKICVKCDSEMVLRNTKVRDTFPHEENNGTENSNRSPSIS